MNIIQPEPFLAECGDEQLENEVDEEIDEKGKPIGFCETFKNELVDRRPKTATKFDFKAAFGKMCEPETPELLAESPFKAEVGEQIKGVV